MGKRSTTRHRSPKVAPLYVRSVAPFVREAIADEAKALKATAAELLEALFVGTTADFRAELLLTRRADQARGLVEALRP